MQFLNCTQEAEWIPFQTYYFSENLAGTRIEPLPPDLKTGTLDHRDGNGVSLLYRDKLLNRSHADAKLRGA
jgi:hypothetical protein